MTPDSSQPVAAPFVGSLLTPDGLCAARLGEPTRLTLRLANVGTHSYYTLLPTDEARQARLTLDLAAAGLAAPGELPAAPLGFRWEAGPDAHTLTLRQATRYWPWLTGDVLEVELPALTGTGEPSLRQLPLTLTHLDADDRPAALTVPLLLLPAGAALPDFTVGPVPGGADVADELTLRLDWPVAGENAADNGPAATAPTFYVLLSAGLAGGQRPLAAPGAAAAIELAVPDGSPWQAEQVVAGPYPAWRVGPAAGAAPAPAGELHLQLRHLPARPRPDEAAHLLVFGLNLPGGGAGGQVVSLRPGGGPTRAGNTTERVVIERFTASPEQFTTTTAPVEISLSWLVSNAEFVTLSGVGVVGSKATEQSVFVEGTTTFVLTAYSSKLDQIAARAVQVTLAAGSPLPPPGSIMLWNGKADEIPPGWALCDGRQHGTPDLRERFVLGAGITPPHDKGDAQKHTHLLDATSLTVHTETAGRHTHLLPDAVSAADFLKENAHVYLSHLSGTGPAPSQVQGVVMKTQTVQESGAHAHQMVINFGREESKPNAQDYRPAWYALCYIMKLPA